MDSTYLVLGLAVLATVVYLGRLLIRERGDFEAGGQSGHHKFFVKAKQRK